ncbi:hypothetical protein [Eisenbergiella sp.]|uniref:hypothetical protein n=1 Tax=Eisenbergiella sp. TaxID=1924109 RepID=UPI002A82D9A8|nr:hypothetical protein [Eisenbergiella sp.]
MNKTKAESFTRRKRMGVRIKFLQLFSALLTIMMISSCSSDSSGVRPGREDPVQADVTQTPDGQAETEASLQTEPAMDSPTETELRTGEGMQPDPNDAARMPEQVPDLLQTGRNITDFVPENWELMDSAELDYNQDGIPDYVGVLQYRPPNSENYGELPRILFAIYSEGAKQYRLDFQDANLIRTMSEGGIFGDPYLPLTAEKCAFTIHTYGGSAWRWSEDFTYIYKEGIWYLNRAEKTYGYGFYVTDYSLNDYETGIGIRKKRSSNFSDMELVLENAGETDMDDIDAYPYDLIYEVSLDAPPTLYQAGMRWWLAPDRMTEWPVDTIEIAGGIDLEPDQVQLPGENTVFKYNDEEYMLYHFFKEDRNKEYIVLYEIRDKKLSVLAAVEKDHFNEIITLYQGKVYYSSYIKESDPGVVQTSPGVPEKEDDEEVGVRLHQVDKDGTQQVIFAYLPERKQSDDYPYYSLICEFNGGELVAEVYIGDEAHPFYTIDLESGDTQFMGQVPKK